DSFIVAVSDPYSSTLLHVNPYVQPVNDPPSLVNTGPVDVYADYTGAVHTLTPADLYATDVDNTPAQLTYTITQAPVLGVLYRFGVPLGVNSTFTQADIDAGLMDYYANPSVSGVDTIGFTLSDGVIATPIAGSFAINVIHVNTPPVAGLHDDPYALAFNGVQDTITIPNNAVFNPVGPFTVSAWVRARPTQNAYFIVIDKSHGQIDSTGWVIQGDSALANISFGLGQGGQSTTNFAGATSVTDIRDGSWHHIAGVYTGTQAHIYIDGVLEGSGAVPVPVVHNTRGLNIGQWWQGGRSFNGEIDEVRIWNVARTQAQIRADMNRRLLGNEPGLVGYWNFDEGSGTVVKDLTANANNGTLGGGNPAQMPVWTANTPPVMVSPGALTMVQDSYATIDLDAFDANGDPLTLTISTLPAAGTLYQVSGPLGAPVIGPQIVASYSQVTDVYGRVIFQPAPGATGQPYAILDAYASDPYASSAAVQITVDVYAQPVSPGVIYVDPQVGSDTYGGVVGWTDAYATLNHAVAVAKPGDTIMLAATDDPLLYSPGLPNTG
ncbi:MAG: hypothetical protein D6717_05870, partial [Gammaproteobacteria bacterium]